MSTLLIELWDKIMTELDCQSILNIRLAASNFNKYSDLYFKKKMKGFPRITGKYRQYF